MAKAVVLGGGGFIGTHMVRYLKKKGYWVKVVDIKTPKWSSSDADDFHILDLRSYQNCLEATRSMDEVYNLAADMGGMGFITTQNCRILHNNSLINANTIKASQRNDVRRYFFSSSVCVYPIDKLATVDPKPLKEEDACPANPQEGYGWEKLIHEIRCLYYFKEHWLETRVARFHNTYGPEGEYEGGREKAPAALCRKAILAPDGGEIEVWGDGKTTRTFTYVDDLVEGIYRLTQSNYRALPVNLGNERQISIEDLTKLIIKISGKDLKIKYVKGPQGVRGRAFDNSLARKELRWTAKTPLEVGMKKTYKWIKKQINAQKVR